MYFGIVTFKHTAFVLFMPSHNTQQFYTNFFGPLNFLTGLHQHSFRGRKRSYYLGQVWVWRHKWSCIVSWFSWWSKWCPSTTASSGIWQWSTGNVQYLILHSILLSAAVACMVHSAFRKYFVVLWALTSTGTIHTESDYIFLSLSSYWTVM